ncbi:hypothetical protein AAZX31_15G204500 [Glycine max]|nr:hypothetical protein JHK87_043108 [Glycine soja]KAG4949965.1 hypothetical protein JHK86_043204 [Glycine max]KAG4957466.1 hypothetical protein JHK85_043846 [Glycine max]KAG5106204.1 hypothetical protein JHK82_043174 [Glycine max]KAG5117281.1 hypothetical protein JHK84_043394 [Glycine max]
MTMRKAKWIHYWSEVAPAVLISRSRKSSNFVKLETIIEEEIKQGCNSLHKGVLVSFPLLLSGLMYILLGRGMV